MKRSRRVVHSLPRKGTIERAAWDGFYGGVCCTLSAAIYAPAGIKSGTESEYLDVVTCVGAKELLGFARRENDVELPRIRRAVQFLKRKGEFR